MDQSSPQDHAEPDEGISALVDEFFDRRQSGEDLTPERFASEHPEVAKELRLCLQGLPLIEKACLSPGGAPAGEAAPAAGEFPAIEGYDLIKEIGRGGMGVVYQALQASTKRIVALKVMLAGPFASSSGRRRFDREVELAARLQHRSIVRVLEGGRVAQQPYYAMDYVDGVPLNRHLATSSIQVRTTLALFAELCEAIEYAHGHGVVHRDLKPANVLIDNEGMPHILDFGLAKATDQADNEEGPTTCISLPGQVVGTLFYLSPEQAAGTPQEIDSRTDVYTLGVMLFEALTGSLPFDIAGRPSRVIQRILEDPPIRPTSLSDLVDAELETIVLKALEKDQARRYQSAKELAEDIRRYLEGEPVLARRPSSLYVLRKKFAKHRLAAALGAVVVALSLTSLLAGLWWRQHELANARRTALACQEVLDDGATSSAVRSAEALFERHPELPEARLILAQVLFRNEGLPRRAIRFLEGQLQRDPSPWASRALLAEIYRLAGNAEQADGLQAQAEGDSPDTAEAWYLRSFATLDLHTALRCARQAVQREPSHALAWQRLTGLCLKTGRLEDALRGADRLIELGQNNAQWIFFKGQAFASQGRFRQAIEQYSQVIAINPLGSKAYRYRAHAYRRVKEYEQSVADYTKAVELAGDKASYALPYQRATALWILGRTDEALEDYRQVRVMLGGPFYSDARRFLILRQQGRRREAEEVLQAALGDVKDHWLRQVFRCLASRITPDELVADGAARDNLEQLCEAYYYAGEACLLSNQPRQARRWFEQCVQTGLEFDPDTSPVVPMNEYELARWRLESLPASPSTAPVQRKN
jgi:serine/threonine protein kinase/Tfp pilus assembly protein PilF